MRIFLGTVALAVTLVGCVASRQEVATRLGDQYVGQNVDVLVVKFGPPASTFKMNSGDTYDQTTRLPIVLTSSVYPNKSHRKPRRGRVPTVAWS